MPASIQRTLCIEDFPQPVKRITDGGLYELVEEGRIMLSRQ